MGVAPPLVALKPFPEVAEKWAHNEYCELILIVKSHINLNTYNLIEKVLGGHH